MNSATFNPYIFYGIAIVFLALLGILAYLGWVRTKNSDDFMLAGKRVPPWLMAISYGSALISTSSIVGFGGKAGEVGLAMVLIVAINIGMGVIMAYIVFGPRIRAVGTKMGAQTMPELLGLRFKSKFIQGVAGVVNFVFMPLYAGAVLVSVSRLMETIIGINFGVALIIYAVIIAIYVVGGGLKGMIFADAVLGILKFVGVATMFIIVLSKAGGFGAFSAVSQVPVPEALVKEGVRSFGTLPVFGSPIWWQLITTLFFGISVGLLSQPQLGVRFLTLKNTRDIKIAVGFGAVFVLVVNGGGILTGALSNLAAYSNPAIGKTAIEMVGMNVDSIIPFAIRSFLPEWLGYIILFTLFSAALSTSTAQIHTMATSLGYDFMIKGLKVKASIGLVKAAALISLAVVIVVGYLLPKSIVATATAMFFGIAASVFLPSICGAIFWKRCTRAASIASMLTGIGTIVFMYFFVHIKESASIGLCNMFFGKPSLFEGHWLSMCDPTCIAVPLSFLALFAVGFLTKVTNEESI
ncbi:MAG: sodium:solute symporter family protein [Caldisericia bacterium]|nr:sodium:solute symporter family protein [Caldisericia bacterium]